MGDVPPEPEIRDSATAANCRIRHLAKLIRALSELWGRKWRSKMRAELDEEGGFGLWPNETAAAEPMPPVDY